MNRSSLVVLLLAFALGCAADSKGRQAGDDGGPAADGGDVGTGSDEDKDAGALETGNGSDDVDGGAGNAEEKDAAAGDDEDPSGGDTDPGGSSGGGSSGGGSSGGGSSGGGSSGGGSSGGGSSGGGSSGGGSSGGGSSGGGSSGGGTGGGTTTPPTRTEFCMGAGPVVTVPTGTGTTTTCTGTIAKDLFTHALCSCEDVTFAGYLATQSWDSSDPESQLISQGAPVGVNGGLFSGSYVDVGGTLSVQGATTFAGYLSAYGDLELESDITLAGLLTVGRDAWFQGNAGITSGFIGRDLHTTGAPIQPPFWFGVGGSRSESSFDLDTPCACEPEDLLDIDAIVDDGKLNNHNADPSVNLDPASLTDVVGDKHITLPCGRYFVNEISGVGHLEITVTGRTALYVDGDVAFTGYLDIDLGPSGELDLFVRGNLLQIGYGAFGDPNRPSSVRVYVGGDDDISVLVGAGYQPFAGNLYAPEARLVSAGYIDIDGSAFVKSAFSAGYIQIDYDRDILDDDDECQPPPTDPPECTDVCKSGCGETNTCVDGTCGPCVSDADCCAPLVCYLDGHCGPLLY